MSRQRKRPFGLKTYSFHLKIESVEKLARLAEHAHVSRSELMDQILLRAIQKLAVKEEW